MINIPRLEDGNPDFEEMAKRIGTIKNIPSFSLEDVYQAGRADMQQEAVEIGIAIDSNRGNEKEIVKAIRNLK